MSSLDNITKLKDINALAGQTARAINELLINGLSGVGGTADVFTGATSLTGGESGLVPAPAAGDDEKFLRGDGTWAAPPTVSGGASSDVIVAGSTVLDTVPVTVDGGIWYDTTDGVPTIFIRKYPYTYSFNSYDSFEFVGTAEDALVSYLPCDVNPTLDAFGHTWRKAGSATIDTDVKKFGTGSVHLPSGAYLYADNIIALDADKWTFDAWIFVKTFLSNNAIFALGTLTNTNGNNGCSGIQVLCDNIEISHKDATWQSTKATMVTTANRWMHYAVVKDGDILYFFRNGALYWKYTLTVPMRKGTRYFLGHSVLYGNGADLYFDNVRFYKDYARWTAAFTVPDASDYL